MSCKSAILLGLVPAGLLAAEPVRGDLRTWHVESGFKWAEFSVPAGDKIGFTPARLGYHAALVSLGASKTATAAEHVAHCRAVAEIMPLFGFYMQPAVGGCVLPYSFWRRFAEI
ncbi:MAG: hypothetical protein L0Z50_11235, partial [Verrucomicrobiales bacterium]|nr:hypothetical protein [Verrucomicrobiales bacterium]